MIFSYFYVKKLMFSFDCKQKQSLNSFSKRKVKIENGKCVERIRKWVSEWVKMLCGCGCFLHIKFDSRHARIRSITQLGHKVFQFFFVQLHLLIIEWDFIQPENSAGNIYTIYILYENFVNNSQPNNITENGKNVR
jgi:hypothetical protein